MVKVKRIQNKKYFANVVLMVLPGISVAGEFTEYDLLGEIPTVDAASRFEQRLERAPASVTIIDRELIEMSGAQSFVDIFRLVPGFQSYYVGNNRYGISYHGLGREFPNQIEVMVNGRSVYETIFASVNWSTLGITIADIDHIQVVRGSNAAARGSNAFMGSINIVTRQPIHEEGWEIESTVGDLQTRNTLISYSDRAASVDYRLSIGYQRNDGFPATDTGALKDGRELALGNLEVVYTPTLLDTVELSLGYAKDRIGWGDADHPDEYSLAKGYNSYQSVKWLRNGSGENQYQIHGSHSLFRISNFDELGPLYRLLGVDDATARFLTAVQPFPEAIVNLVAEDTGISTDAALALLEEFNTEVYGGFGHLESERYDLQFQHNFALGSDIRGAWGVGGRQEWFVSRHPQSYDQDIDELSLRFFAHGEWRATERLTWNAGAMVEDSHVGVLVSPRVSVNYQLSPTQSVRLAAAKGNRAPSLLEANENTVSRVGDVVFDVLRVADPNLREEKLESFELAYLLQLPDPRLTLDVRFFNERITEVIDEVLEALPPEVTIFGDSSLKIIENNGYWEFTGGEMQLSFNVTDSTFFRLHYANTDLESEALLRRSPWWESSDKNDRMARHSGGVLVGHQFTDSLSGSVTAYHQSGLRWEDGDSIGAFNRVDFQLAYKFKFADMHGDIRFVVQNAGGDYPEFNTNNVFETRYFLTARMELPD